MLEKKIFKDTINADGKNFAILRHSCVYDLLVLVLAALANFLIIFFPTFLVDVHQYMSKSNVLLAIWGNTAILDKLFNFFPLPDLWNISELFHFSISRMCLLIPFSYTTHNIKMFNIFQFVFQLSFLQNLQNSLNLYVMMMMMKNKLIISLTLS